MKLIYSLFLIMLFIFEFAFANNHMTSGGILKSGSWALSPVHDLFKKRYPVVAYLPPGTIIFESKQHGIMKDYIEVLTHYGHKVLIKQYIVRNKKKIRNILPFSSIVKPPKIGNNKFIIHEDILCLNEQDRIKLEKERCFFSKNSNKSAPKLGKGWIYSFEKKKGTKNWLILKAHLDTSTKDKIRNYGLEPVNANFDISEDELSSYEESGYITLLNKNMPLVEFIYKKDSEFFLKCGLEKVDTKYIQSKLSTSLSTETKKTNAIKLLSWITGVNIGVSADAGVGTDNETKVSINTKEKSYLFYDVIMKDRGSEEENLITIRKDFTCTSGASNKPGLDITDITFSINPNDATDTENYVFSDSKIILNTPEKVKKIIGRPVFFSVNSSVQQNSVLKYIMQEYEVSMQMAHFMLTNMNYTCKSGRNGKVRSRCLKLYK